MHRERWTLSRRTTGMPTPTAPEQPFFCHRGGSEMIGVGRVTRSLVRILPCFALLVVLLTRTGPVFSQTVDWITGLPRQDIHVKSWPNSKRVAVCFILYVEVWGHGNGPNFRPDMNGRSPDVVDEAFRQYAIEWGVPRVGRLFRDMNVPLSLALNSQFLEQRPEAWKKLRSFVPSAPIIAHGLNNSTELLPLAK